MTTNAENFRPPQKSERGVVHVYDGIREMDNRLPRWWLYVLYGTIVFGAGYWVYFHSFSVGELPSARYEREQAEAISEEAERVKNAGEVTPEMLTLLAKDSKTVADGKAIFDSNCVTCHAEGGKGNIGPNLTDDYWLHGGAPLDIYKTVHDGVPEKQMPTWGAKLGELRLRTVVAYVLSIRGTNVSGGKAPQGEKE